MTDSTGEQNKFGLEEFTPENGEAKFVTEILGQMKDIDSQLTPHLDVEIGEHFDVSSIVRVAIEDLDSGAITIKNVPADERKDFELVINPKSQRVYLFTYRKSNIGPRQKSMPDLHDTKYIDLTINDRTLKGAMKISDDESRINPFVDVGNLDPQFSAWYGGGETAVRDKSDGSRGSDLEKESLTLTLDGMTDIGARLSGSRLRQEFVVRHLPEKGGHWRGNEFIEEIHPPGFYPQSLDFKPRDISRPEALSMHLQGMNKAQSIAQSIVATEAKRVDPALLISG